MSETARRLERLARPHARGRVAAVLLAAGGAALALAAFGLAAAPRLAAIGAAWGAIVAVAAAAAWAVARVRRRAAAPAVARLVERAGRVRAGSVAALVTPTVGGGASPALLAAADRRAAGEVARAAPAVVGAMSRDTLRGLLAGLLVAGGGAALFGIATPGAGRAEPFWNPFAAWRDAHAPVRLAVERAVARRGERVGVSVVAPGATRAILWTRGPGEPWRPTPLGLDSAGRVRHLVGPLTADLHLRAASGGRSSAERTITVARAAFVTELDLTARFPAYLDRPDEPLVPGPDTLVWPAGAEVVTRGAASVPLDAAAWARDGAPGAARLRVSRHRFEGRFTPRPGGTWRLGLATADGAPLEGEAPLLIVRLVGDSAPVVAVPVPGRDTTLPLSLRQPLVVDVRDDHGVSRVAVVSWRVSRTGKVGEPVTAALAAGPLGDRALVQGELNLEDRGLLPGDTVRFHVEAWDNAPVARRARSPEIALRLPTREELRSALRAGAREAVASAESLVTGQAGLAERTRDLAQERARDAVGPAPFERAGERAGALPFQATERADAVAGAQAQMLERIRELGRAVEELARAAEAAGVGDSAFEARLAEVRELLERALTPELEQRLRELQEALARLDPEATREALQRLAEAQQQLRRELERSRELFRRAAVEGALASLAADAEALREAQRTWNREQAGGADSAAAAGERGLAGRADSLARGIARALEDLAASAPPPDVTQPLAGSRAATERAGDAMRGAAGHAERGDARGARAAGEEAADALEPVPDSLRAQRDRLAREWRAEALAALDRALAETAALAARQEGVARALRDGRTGAETRRAQASVEEGTQAIERQVQEAAGRHALVSPRLEHALGYAQRQMREAREQLAQGDPNGAAAAALAEEALDALNATAYALARSRAEVAGAQSGTGFQEAIERLARLAAQQQGIAGDGEGLMPLMAPGGQAVLEQLRALAARQRALAEQLERLRAEGATSAAEALAREARELARELDAGRLDRRTIARQERLYRRLLDAGRTLTGPEPDNERERTSRPATGDSVRRPPALAPGATGAGPRLRYPTWDELAALTPEQRRLVLEYFRRLNAPRAPGEAGP